MRFSRTDRSLIAHWWQTVDRQLLMMVMALLGLGLLLSLAASPAIALKRGFTTYHFVERQLLFDAIAACVLVSVSFLTPIQIRRLALTTLGLGLAGLVAVLIWGHEINGARRWIAFLGQTLQPSEFAKPGFIVISAWLFAETKRSPDMPALYLVLALAALMAALLVAEPDIGQTLLTMTVWGALYLISGQSLRGAALLLVLAVGGLGVAYISFGHVQARVDQYLAHAVSGVAGDHSQVDRSLQAITEGGFFGRGPGEGTVKTVLPDAHTDFIFAVVAEEYGIIACLGLLALFAAIALKAVLRAGREADSANRLAIFGLVLLFSLQAGINIGVNIGLLPAKGMTLPFISAGGSSTIAVALALGMVLALTRRRVDLANLKKPPLVATSMLGNM